MTVRPARWFPICALLLAACSAPAVPSTPSSRTVAEGAPTAAPKRISLAVAANVPTLVDRLSAGGVGVPGLTDLQKMLSPGLTVRDDQGALRPILAESAPTLENGLWTLLPDGRMQTIWKIKTSARWQDGIPFTSEDVVFTARVDRDPEVPMRRAIGYQSVESIEAPDSQTVRVTWKQPYIQADMLFDDPLFPQHILESAFQDDKPGFPQLSYWTDDFIGTGAFRLQQYVRGSHMVLQANDDYVLGRPKIDEIEVKFIPDPATLMANVLAGSVELTLGRGISLEQVTQLRDQWKQGGADIAFTSWLVIYPQFVNPTPAIVGDAQFRRALMHALDRQQMADSLQGGLVPVAHTFLHPREPDYAQVEDRIVKYDFDPRRAMDMIQALGYTRGADGMFQDSNGRGLSLEIRTSPEQDIQVKTLFAIADAWEHVGVATEPNVMAEQRIRDREYVQTFPAFLMYRQPNDPNGLLLRLYSWQAPMPENNFVGRNHPRYRNPEFDAMIDRYYTTIPKRERTAVLGDIIHHTTDLLTMMGLFYDAEPVIIGNRLVNVAAAKSADSTPVWNVDLWDVRGG
ncbi:MAG TPA: ABC transporter substrate-binding protein [Chloroflexota bacterium]|nr:ABC transporter substrate-binding protein [Chloroflexota bacterium]